MSLPRCLPVALSESAEEAPSQAVAESVGRVLEAVGAASGIMRALQQHYVTVIGAPARRPRMHALLHAEAAARHPNHALLGKRSGRAATEHALFGQARCCNPSLPKPACTVDGSIAEERSRQGGPPGQGPTAAWPWAQEIQASPASVARDTRSMACRARAEAVILGGF